MIKKIYVVLVLTLLITSCGKKGDPKYEELKSSIYYTKDDAVV